MHRVAARDGFGRHTWKYHLVLLTIAGLSLCLFCFASVSEGKSLAKRAPKALKHDLFSVSFPTDKDGFACGRSGTILGTTDGGNTWSKLTTGVDSTLSSIHFVNPKTGWAVGDVGTILATSDGGKTWVKQTSPVKTLLMGVYFVSPKTGFIVTEKTTILATKDGGVTWQVQFSGEDFILRSVSFADERNGWAVGENGFVYHTDNGGATWTKQAGEFGFSEETGEMVGGNFLFSVYAVSPKIVWAAGIDGEVIHTDDGGASWKKATKGVPKVHLFGIIAQGNNVLIAGSALLLKSNDGGSFASPSIKPPITYGWLYGFATRGKAGFVATGKEGRIYLSDTTGSNWWLSGAK